MQMAALVWRDRYLLDYVEYSVESILHKARLYIREKEHRSRDRLKEHYLLNGPSGQKRFISPRHFPSSFVDHHGIDSSVQH